MKPTIREQAHARSHFLAMLVGKNTRGYLEIRTFKNGKPGPREWVPVAKYRTASQLVAKYAMSRDVYVGAVARTEYGYGKKEHCGNSWALWADCDTAASVEALSSFEPYPTVIVESGSKDGGISNIHAWWALKDPLPREQLEDSLSRLASALGSDPVVADLSRVMRLPATFNNKGGKPKPVICSHVSCAVYSANEVVGALPPSAERSGLKSLNSHISRPLRTRTDSAAACRCPSYCRVHDLLLEIPPEEYIEALTGLEVSADRKVCCPFHDDSTPSLHVYEDDWYCYGCDLGGSIYDFGAEFFLIRPTGAQFFELRQTLAQSLSQR